MATARLEDLHGRVVHFGEKHVGSTFQEAMMDPAYMSYVLRHMIPKKFEEELFTKYVKMALAPHLPPPPPSELMELEATILSTCYYFLSWHGHMATQSL